MEDVLAELNAIEKELGPTRFSDGNPGSIDDVKDRVANLESALRKIINLMKAACEETGD